MSLPREQQDAANYQKAFNVQDVRQPGMGGIVTLQDQHDIKDQESPDMLNMWFDMGVIGNRPGSTLFATKPTGETGTPLQLAIAKTSDGVNYIISVYTSGTTTNNFYVWDSTNSRWIKINGAYTPTFSKILYFGSQNWNMQYADDRLYFGNAYDDTTRWRISLNYLSTVAADSDTALTLTDASRFHTYQAAVTAASGTALTISASPNATAAWVNSWERGQMVYFSDPSNTVSGLVNGTIYYAIPSLNYATAQGQTTIGLATTLANAVAGTAISVSGSPSNVTVYKADPITIYDGTTTTNAIYYLRSGNVLTLTAAVGITCAAGSSVCPTLTDRPGIPKGNVLTTFQARFVSAGGHGTENTVYLSRTNEPEDNATSSAYVSGNSADISAGGFQMFNDGGGGIIDVKNFGQFLLVEKSNGMSRFQFSVNDALSAQIAQSIPVISGVGMGPVSLRSNILAMNSVYYPSSSAGFIALSPAQTGANASTGLQVISYNINNILPKYDFSTSKGVFYKNKILWTAISQTTENVIFMYDTIRNVWSKFDSWNPADMAVTNSNQLLYLSTSDGNIYQAFASVYTDNGNPYYSSYKTKMMTLGNSYLVKTLDAIYVEGYMTQGSTLYADVLFNEREKLFTSTYKIANGVTGLQFTNVNMGGLSQFGLYQVIQDSLPPDQLQNFGYFRGYLSVPLSYGLFALQVKFYSKDANSVWFLTGYSTKPVYEESLPPQLLIDSVTPINITF